MKMVARFVTRPTGKDGKGPPDLILGAAFKGAESHLNAGKIYEIREILGELVIAEVGPAAIGWTHKTSLIGRVSWTNDVNYILEMSRSHHLLTAAEFQEQVNKVAKLG